MKINTVKTYINQLHKKLGSNQKVARYLGISLRYVIYLKKGERTPSHALRQYIKIMLKELTATAQLNVSHQEQHDTSFPTKN